jgi:hypothetical protein
MGDNPESGSPIADPMMPSSMQLFHESLGYENIVLFQNFGSFWELYRDDGLTLRMRFVSAI